MFTEEELSCLAQFRWLVSVSEWRVHWSAGLNDIPSPALHGFGLMSNVTLWPLSLDQPLNADLSLVRRAN